MLLAGQADPIGTRLAPADCETMFIGSAFIGTIHRLRAVPCIGSGVEALKGCVWYSERTCHMPNFQMRSMWGKG